MSKQKHNSKGTRVSAERLPALGLRSWSAGTIVALLIVTGSSLALNFTGLNWGQPGGHPWTPDSIAGTSIVQHMPNLFGKWRHKYPRFHFMVNAAFYKPLLNHWRKNPVTAPVDQGRRVGRSVLNMERISTLIIVSRVISALMGTGAVVALFLTARLLFNDNVAAFFSALALAFSMHFVFYSHLGNTDVPCTFWFAWSLYWAVKATFIGKWRYFILLGLFCSLTVCTKDPAVGYVIGLGIATWLAMADRARQAGEPFKKALTSVFSMKVLVAVGIAAFCFALLNDLLTTPQAFFNRMNFWFKVGIDSYTRDFPGQWSLFKRTCEVFYYSLGWPLFATVIASTFYCIIRFRWKSAFGILPIIAFYIVVTIKARLSIPRYFIPGFIGLMLLVGKACTDWLRWRKPPMAVRVFPLAFVYILSLLYCVGLDLELVEDARYKAEQWLSDHVTRNDGVVAISIPTYAPRVQLLDCKYSGFLRIKPEYDERLQQIRPHANYIVLGEKEASGFDPEFLKELLAGSKGYKEVARFSNKYLYPKKTVFGFAGWPIKRMSVSPEIIIFKRDDRFAR